MVAAKRRVLLADDDPGLRRLIGTTLGNEDFDLLHATDGEEALEIVRSNPDVHLLLLDMHMPKLTGLETLRRVKQMKSRLPCILLSAGLDDAIRDQARQAEVYSVLAKPVSRCDITSVVLQALRRTYGW